MNIKEIPEHAGYFASDCGKIFSIRGKNKMKEMVPRINSNGYALVRIQVNGRPKCFRLHRLIGITWVDGYKQHLTINHLDTVKSNNAASNLEWATQRRNIRHSVKLGLRSGKAHGLGGSRAVWRQKKNGGEKIISHSICEGCRQVGVKPTRGTPHIHAVLKGKYPTAYGFFWGYVEK